MIADETSERSSPKAIKYALARKHMFYAAFENSIYEDYVTEKLFDALVAGSVPIYIGAPNVLDFVPDRNAIIQLRSMEEVPAVVEEIRRLMANRTAHEVSRKSRNLTSFRQLGLKISSGSGFEMV